MQRSVLFLFGAMALASGCGGARATMFKPFAGQFPTREELLKLEETPPAAIPVRSKATRVESYTPGAPIPERPSGRADYAESWAATFVETVEGAQGRIYASKGMRCLAEELGRFYLAHGSHPTPSLTQHLAAHCGVNEPRPASYFYGGDVGEARSADQAAVEWRDQIRGFLDQALVGGTFQAGLWFGEADGQAAFAVVYSRRHALISGVEDRGDALVVRGQTLEKYGSVVAMVTRGAYGFEVCSPAPNVPLPRFELQCPYDATDAETWLEIVGYQPGRLLGDHLFLHRRAGEGFDPTYRAPTAAASTDADYERGTFTAVNAIRAEAGLEPLAFEEGQSQTNRRVTPHYYAAVMGQETVIAADWIAMGLMAGWDVEGSIARGYISSHWQQEAVDPAAFVEELVRTPFNRRALLNPRARRVAIGSLALERHVGVLITTYELFSDADRSQLAEVVTDRLNQLRAAAGQAPVSLDPIATEEAERAARGVEDPEINPERAVQAGLNAVANRSRGAASYWLIAGVDLEDLDYPPALLEAPAAKLGLAVTVYRDPSSPWGMYYVIIYVVGGGQMV